MPDKVIDFDFQGARKAGATPSDFNTYFKSQYNIDFDFNGAYKAGATDNDILTYLNSRYASAQPKKKEPFVSPLPSGKLPSKPVEKATDIYRDFANFSRQQLPLAGVESAIQEHINARKEGEILALTPEQAAQNNARLRRELGLNISKEFDKVGYVSPTERKKESAIRMAAPAIKQLVNDIVDEWDRVFGLQNVFFTPSGAFNLAEARKQVRSRVQELGGGDATEKMILAELKREAEFRRDKPKFEAIYKEELAKEGVNIKEELNKAFVAGAEKIKQQNSIGVKEIEEKADEIKSIYVPSIKQQAESVKQKINVLNAQYESGVLNRKVYEQNFAQLEESYQQTYNQLNQEYKQKIAEVNAKLQSRNRRINRELQVYQNEFNQKPALEMLPPATQKKVKAAMERAAKRFEASKITALREQDNALFEIFGMTGGMGAFATKNFFSGINKAVADLGEYFSSQGLSSQAIDWARNRATQAEELQSGQYEFGARNVVGNVFSSLGASAPSMIPSIAIGLATRGRSMGLLGDAALMGATVHKVEQIQNAGDIYGRVLNETGDVAKAQEAVAKYKQNTDNMIGWYMLGGISTKLLLGLNSLGKAAGGVGFEILEEIPIEIKQSYESEKIAAEARGETFNKTISQFVSENPQMLIDTVTAVIGQSIVTGGVGKIFAGAEKSIPQNFTQHLTDMVQKKGVNVANSSLELLWMNGKISKELYDAGRAKIAELANGVAELESIGIKGAAANLYLSMADRVKELRAKANEMGSDALKISFETKAKAIEKQMGELATNNLPYVTITMKGGADMTRVITIEDLTELQQQGKLDGLIDAAQEIEIVNAKGVEVDENIKTIISDLRTKIESNKEFEQKQDGTETREQVSGVVQPTTQTAQEQTTESGISEGTLGVGQSETAATTPILTPALSSVEETAKALEGKNADILKPPTAEQKFDDVKNKRTSTFIYSNESEVPSVLRDKITSKSTIDGKTTIKVTLPISEAEYLLYKDNPQAISELYHAAKAKPETEQTAQDKELIEAVEQLLAPQQAAQAETPKAEAAKPAPIIEEPKPLKDFGSMTPRQASVVYGRVNEVSEMNPPTDAYGIALLYFAQGGKISEQGINEVVKGRRLRTLNTGKKETLSGEAKARDYRQSPKEAEEYQRRKGVPATVETISEDLAEAYNNNLEGDKFSETDIRDKLEEVLTSFNTRFEAAQAYLESYDVEYAEQKHYEYFGGEDAYNQFAQENAEEIELQIDELNTILQEDAFELEALEDLPTQDIETIITQYETDTQTKAQQPNQETKGTSSQKDSGTIGAEKEATSKEIEKVAESASVSPKNLRDLYNINRTLFSLNRVKALASAVLMDRMLGVMAKRAGIAKSEMYARLKFQKASEENIPQGVLMQVDAWHGSPYEFDKFTTEKIGTGEGAQAFGWGLYFTDLESIARNYAEALAKINVSVPYDKNPDLSKYSKYLIEDASNTVKSYKGDKDLAIKQETKSINEIKSNMAMFPEKYDNSYNRRNLDYKEKILGALKDLEFKIERNLYKVSLHKGKSPSEYTWLEWDKKVDKNLFEKIAKQLEIDDNTRNRGERVGTFNEFSKRWKDADERFNTYKDYKNGEVYEKLAKVFGAKDASLLLLRAGIDGIKYPAESIARGATSDTARGFNYVVFDENAVSIEEVIKFQKDANKARGAVMVTLDGRAMVYALTDPNVSTPMHEMAHIFEHYLNDEERKVVEEWANTSEWDVETSEKFARGFEKYLAEGGKPNSPINKIFEKFKEWLLDIYNGITNSEIDIELNDEMRAIYDKMLGIDSTKASSQKEGKPQPSQGKRLYGVYQAMYKSIPESQRTKFEEGGWKEYEPDNGTQALELAYKIIEEAGIDEAFEMTKEPTVKGTLKTGLFNAMLNTLSKTEVAAKDEAVKEELARKYAEIFYAFQKSATDAGQMTNAIKLFYQSPLGQVYLENRNRKEAFEAQRKEYGKSWDEVYEEMSKDPKFTTLVQKEVVAFLAKSDENYSKKAAKAIRGLREKLKKEGLPSWAKADLPDGTELQGAGEDAFIAVIDKVLAVAEKAFLAGSKLEAVIADAVEAIRNKFPKANKDEVEKYIYEALSSDTAIGKKLSQEEKVQKRIDEITKRIAKLKQQLADGITPQPKETITSPEIEALLKEETELRKKLREKLQATPEAQAKAEQKSIDKLNQEIDTLRQQIADKKFPDKEKQEKKVSDEVKALQNEKEKLLKQANKIKKDTDAYRQKAAKAFLKRFKKRLEGLNEAQKEKVIRRSFAILIEKGALDTQEFRAIIAEALGLQELTETEANEYKTNIETINKHTDALAAWVQSEGGKAETIALQKARIEALQARNRISEIVYSEVSLLKRLRQLTQLTALTAITLVKNITWNVSKQSLLFSSNFLLGLIDNSIAFSTKMLREIGVKIPLYNAKTPIVSNQGVFFGGLRRGLEEGYLNVKYGVPQQDLANTTLYAAPIRPLKASQDLLSGKVMGGAAKTDAVMQAISGWYASAISKGLVMMDKPLRFASEASRAYRIGKDELKMTPKQLEIFVQAPKQYAVKFFISQGLSKEAAEEKASAIEARIIQAGDKAVAQQDNIANMLFQSFSNFFSKQADKFPIVKFLEAPFNIAIGIPTALFVKTPANIMWNILALANPALGYATAITWQAKAIKAKSQGDPNWQLYSDSARDYAAWSTLGMAASVLGSWFIANGLVTSGDDDEKDKKVAEAERDVRNARKFNWSKFQRLMMIKAGFDVSLEPKKDETDLLIDLSWFGEIGAILDIQQRFSDYLKKQGKGKDLLSMFDLEYISNTYEVAIDGSIFESAAVLSSMFSSYNGFKGYGTNTLGLYLNLIFTGQFTQMSRQSVPYDYKIKADSFTEQVNNMLSVNVPFYRKLTNTYPPERISIWGEPIPRDASNVGFVKRLFGFSDESPTNFGYELFQLYRKTGDAKYLPSVIEGTVSVDNKTVKLTETQKDNLKIFVGQQRKLQVSALYDNKIPYIEITLSKDNEVKRKEVFWRDMTDEQKKESLANAYDVAREAGVNQFKLMYPELYLAEFSKQEKALESASRKAQKSLMKQYKIK